MEGNTFNPVHTWVFNVTWRFLHWNKVWFVIGNDFPNVNWFRNDSFISKTSPSLIFSFIYQVKSLPRATMLTKMHVINFKFTIISIVIYEFFFCCVYIYKVNLISAHKGFFWCCNCRFYCKNSLSSDNYTSNNFTSK